MTDFIESMSVTEISSISQSSVEKRSSNIKWRIFTSINNQLYIYISTYSVDNPVHGTILCLGHANKSTRFDTVPVIWALYIGHDQKVKKPHLKCGF